MIETVLLIILLGVFALWGIHQHQERLIAQKGYLAYIRSSRRWKRVAKASKKRDGNRCRLCGSRRQLESHHPTYERLYRERPEDLTTLCHDCHAWYTAWHKSGRRPLVPLQ